jgi:hypothetical protein
MFIYVYRCAVVANRMIWSSLGIKSRASERSLGDIHDPQISIGTSAVEQVIIHVHVYTYIYVYIYIYMYEYI